MLTFLFQQQLPDCFWFCVGLQPAPVVYEVTETALKVLCSVTGHKAFSSVTKCGCYYLSSCVQYLSYASTHFCD